MYGPPNYMYPNIYECMSIDNPLLMRVMSGLCSVQPLMGHITQKQACTHMNVHTHSPSQSIKNPTRCN